MSAQIHATSTGASGHLLKLESTHRAEIDPIELLHRVEHHRAGRHVHPQRKRLCRKEKLDHSFREKTLDDLLEHRQHPSMVVGNASAPQNTKLGSFKMALDTVALGQCLNLLLQRLLLSLCQQAPFPIAPGLDLALPTAEGEVETRQPQLLHAVLEQRF